MFSERQVYIQSMHVCPWKRIIAELALSLVIRECESGKDDPDSGEPQSVDACTQ
jgi:hypothetical protein